MRAKVATTDERSDTPMIKPTIQISTPSNLKLESAPPPGGLPRHENVSADKRRQIPVEDGLDCRGRRARVTVTREPRPTRDGHSRATSFLNTPIRRNFSKRRASDSSVGRIFNPSVHRCTGRGQSEKPSRDAQLASGACPPEDHSPTTCSSNTPIRRNFS